MDTITRCARLAEDVDEALHQLDVGRSERAEREVEQRPRPLAQVLGELPGLARAHARLDVVPGARRAARERR